MRADLPVQRDHGHGAAHGGGPDRTRASGILANSAPEFARRKPVGALALGREAGLAASALPFQDRVWAAGDALVGPSTVVEAVAQGRRAADVALRARPSRGPRPEPRRVLVAYESRAGRTARAARLVADRLRPVRRSSHRPFGLKILNIFPNGPWFPGPGPPEGTPRDGVWPMNGSAVLASAVTSRPPVDFSRRPMLVFWETTRACLLACRHCRASATTQPPPGELSTAEGRALIEQVAGFGRPSPILVLTGGDCLLRPGLFDLVEYAILLVSRRVSP
jgi:hypothetical protein